MMLKANRYPGPCGRCGVKIPAGRGAWSPSTGVMHGSEADCKTTTKTYRTYLSRKAFSDYQATLAAQYEAAGLSMWRSQRIEYPSEITVKGSGPFGGVLCLVGGYERGSVMPYGVRIFKGGDLVVDVPRPKVETGDHYADRLAEEQAIIDLVLAAR